MTNATLVHLQQMQEVQLFMILIHDFTLQREKKDINGNFIILDVTIEDKRSTLVNLYGLNRDSPDFFKTVVEKGTGF